MYICTADVTKYWYVVVKDTLTTSLVPLLQQIVFIFRMLDVHVNSFKFRFQQGYFDRLQIYSIEISSGNHVD